MAAPERILVQAREVSGLSPRLPLDEAFRVAELPLQLNWSDPGRRCEMSDRRQRARVYEIVLREGGTPDDVLAYIDGALLVDLWDDLVLPVEIRRAWEPTVKGDEAASKGRRKSQWG